MDFEGFVILGTLKVHQGGGLDVIRKEAWSFYRTISSFRLCRELEKPKGPKGRSPRILGIDMTTFAPSSQVREAS